MEQKKNLRCALAHRRYVRVRQSGPYLCDGATQQKSGRQLITNCRPQVWRRRRDSNPRTACDGYTISSRAPSTGLGDFSKSIIKPLRVSAQKAVLLYHKAVSFVNCFLFFVSAE